MNFTIIIPIYNENKNIYNLVNEIINLNFKNYEIIIVDDCSTDEFIKEGKSKLNNIKNLRIISNKINMGQSFSIYEGVNNSNFDTIITIDGDGQNDPSDINKLYDKFNSSNKIKLVGGLRIKRKDRFLKRISSKIANTIRQYFLNDNCLDTGCSLKVFSKKSFLKIKYFDGMHRFLPALFKNNGDRCEYLPVNHRIRKFGKSKYGTLDRLYKGLLDLFYVRNLMNKND